MENPYRSTRRVWLPFLAAILLPIAAAVIRVEFLQSLGTRVLFITFYPVVTLAAFFGGILPGLLATVVSAVLADYFWIEPFGIFSISSPVDWLSVVVFLISCTIISGTSEAMHRARAKAYKTETEAKLAAEREKAAQLEARYAAQLRETAWQKAESSALLDALFESTPIGVGVLDIDFRFLRMNQALARMNGLAIEEHFGRRPDELLPDLGDWDEVLACWREIVETGQPMLDVEIMGKTPGTLGEVKHWLESWYPVHVEGQIVGLAMTLSDITEPKRMEKERVRLLALAQRRNAETEAILEAINDALLIFDTNLDVVRVNRAYIPTFGFDPVGLNIREIIRRTQCRYPDGRALVFEGLITRRALKGETVLNQAYSITGPGRVEMAIEASVSPLRIDGQIAGTVTVLHDITEQKRSEEALRESEERFRTLFESMTEGVAVHEMIYGESGRAVDYRIISTNPAFEEQTGLKSEQVEGKLGSKAYGTGGAPYLETYARVAESGEPISFESFFPSADAHFRICAFSPKTGQFVTVFENITERKRLEQELRESRDQLEARVHKRTAELLESREQLRYAASRLLNAQENERKRIAQEIHDGLCAQIAAIKFMLERKLAPETGEPFGDPSEAEEIIRNVDRAMEDTRRIMANLRPSLLDDLGLVPTINWFCREFQKLNPEIAIEQRTEIEEDQIPEDLKVTIFRLLQESMSNVRKHSRADLVQISLYKEKSSIVFRVGDNGQGFDPREVPFRKEMGKEFGLRGMKERVELSGGRHELHSSPGQGVSIRAVWEM
jgi:PAS domain S-box-containing protein